MDSKIIKYDIANEMVQNGDILLFHEKDPLSLAIQAYGRSQYNHVGMAAWWNIGSVHKLMVIETRSRQGCTAVSLKNRLERSKAQIDVYKVVSTFTQRKQAVANMVELTGKPYGFYSFLKATLLHLPFVRFFCRTNTDDSTKNGNPDCSYAVASSYRNSGVDLVPNLSDRITEPGDLARSALLKYQFTIEA